MSEKSPTAAWFTCFPVRSVVSVYFAWGGNTFSMSFFPTSLFEPVAQYWSCFFLELIWKSHAEILSCCSLLLSLYCSDLEDDLHKRIRLKDKRGVKETCRDDEGDKGVEKDCWSTSQLYYVQGLYWALGQPWARMSYLYLWVDSFSSPIKSWPASAALSIGFCTLQALQRSLLSVMAGISGCAVSSRGLSNTSSWKQQQTSLYFSLPGSSEKQDSPLLSQCSCICWQGNPAGSEQFCSALAWPIDAHKKLPANFMGPYSICCLRHSIFSPGSFITPFLIISYGDNQWCPCFIFSSYFNNKGDVICLRWIKGIFSYFVPSQLN